MNIHGWDWLVALAAALLVGVAKTGLTGLSLLFVALFASVMPARRSTGVVLPLLILGDAVAFLSYRRHAQWRHVRRLFPWAAAGVIAGAVALGRMNDRRTAQTLGTIVVGLALLNLWRRFRPGVPDNRRMGWFAPAIGVLAGFTTILSNAAGPLIVIYLLSMRLPKMEYMGTSSSFFFLLDLFKLPFMVALGLVTTESLALNLVLAPAVIAGTLLGRWLLGRIDQRMFDTLALVLTLGAGAKMLF